MADLIPGKISQTVVDTFAQGKQIEHPAMKDPNDQLEYINQQIADLQKQPSPEAYVSAFDSKSDDYHVNTGRAEVAELDSLRNMLSTPPEVRPEDYPTDYEGLLYIGLALGLAFYLLKGKI